MSIMCLHRRVQPIVCPDLTQAADFRHQTLDMRRAPLLQVGFGDRSFGLAMPGNKIRARDNRNQVLAPGRPGRRTGPEPSDNPRKPRPAVSNR
jgi:hypothetical protein